MTAMPSECWLQAAARIRKDLGGAVWSFHRTHDGSSSSWSGIRLQEQALRRCASGLPPVAGMSDSYKGIRSVGNKGVLKVLRVVDLMHNGGGLKVGLKPKSLRTGLKLEIMSQGIKKLE